MLAHSDCYQRFAGRDQSYVSQEAKANGWLRQKFGAEGLHSASAIKCVDWPDDLYWGLL